MNSHNDYGHSEPVEDKTPEGEQVLLFTKPRPVVYFRGKPYPFRSYQQACAAFELMVGRRSARVVLPFEVAS